MAAVALMLAWLAGPSSFADRLPVPDVGEALAARLADGAPVFVVRHGAREASVLSAVSTHLDHVVGWCPGDRVFVEPVGATRYDAHGLYVGGPAPTGLAPYEARVTADADAVMVGGLLDPPPRWMSGEPPGLPSDGCTESEGVAGGLFPPGTDPARALPLARLAEAPMGAYVAVRGTIDFDHRPPRLCAENPRGACPADAARVTGFYWEEILPRVRVAWARAMHGSFLVRRAGHGRVDQVAVLARMDGLPPPYRYTVEVTSREREPIAHPPEYAGVVSRATNRGAVVVLEGDFQPVAAGTGGGPPPGARRLTRIELRHPLGVVYQGDMYQPMRSPEWLVDHVARHGPVAVRFIDHERGPLWSVQVFAALTDAQAGR